MVLRAVGGKETYRSSSFNVAWLQNSVPFVGTLVLAL